MRVINVVFNLTIFGHHLRPLPSPTSYFRHRHLHPFPSHLYQHHPFSLQHNLPSFFNIIIIIVQSKSPPIYLCKYVSIPIFISTKTTDQSPSHEPKPQSFYL